MYCICCKKNNVIPAPSPRFNTSVDKSTVPVRTEDNSKNEEDILWKRERRKDGSFVNVNNEMIDNGIIHIIDAGYGSRHDGDQFIIAICDDCIKENLQDSTLLYYSNYMYGEDCEEVEKSKQKYRRKKNLDDLV